MQEILAVALQAMQQDMLRVERVGANLANAMTPGYKRDVVAVRPFAAVVNAMTQDAAASRTSAAIPNGNASDGTVSVESDQRHGTFKSTGQSLDLALGGDGYFEVATDSGPAYTRQGDFRLDARGRLVSAQGYAVMGKGGEIFLSGPTPVIDANGYVYDSAQAIFTPTQHSMTTLPDALSAGGTQDNLPVAQLKIMQTDKPQSLTRLGEGLLGGSDGMSQLNDADVKIQQGFLENSNVDLMQEMVQLMQTMRHFESMQKVATGYDEMIGTAVRRLGDLS